MVEHCGSRTCTVDWWAPLKLTTNRECFKLGYFPLLRIYIVNKKVWRRDWYVSLSLMVLTVTFWWRMVDNTAIMSPVPFFFFLRVKSPLTLSCSYFVFFYFLCCFIMLLMYFLILNFPSELKTVCTFQALRSKTNGDWEQSPPINMARVQIPATQYVGLVRCWLLREGFL